MKGGKKLESVSARRISTKLRNIDFSQDLDY